MTDLLRAFSTLEDEYYPGSKVKRRESQEMRRARRVEERRQEREEGGWDAHPKEIPVKGVIFEMFPIGALAKALGRDSVTIRTWLRMGWLPRNAFQTPRVYGSRGNAGRRLWTRAQIEGIARIAQEEGLLEKNLTRPPRVQNTNFTPRVIEAWKTWRFQ